ncbi:hypothetical protein [Sulfitobacter pontiacus]|uniref:hypothetical protein n=1 Tax=Sulfitobacter pontiacus TaxID=60137 RepID=UPI0030EFA51B
MSLRSVFQIFTTLLVATITLAGWVGLAGPIFGLIIGFIAIAIAGWIWHDFELPFRSLTVALASVGIPGVLSAFLGIADESYKRTNLMSYKVHEFSSQSSDLSFLSAMVACYNAGNHGLGASTMHAFVNIYVKNPVSAFVATSTLPETSVGEQICLEVFAKLREADPELFIEFQSFWPEMPNIPEN